MPRYLVIAHQTLESPELAAAIRERMMGGSASFHLLVPQRHDAGLTWSEGKARTEATDALDKALATWADAGIPVTGEVGEASPVDRGESPVAAASALLNRVGPEAFDEIIVSTLPSRRSKWLAMDAPSRIRRLTTLPVVVVTAPR